MSTLKKHSLELFAKWPNQPATIEQRKMIFGQNETCEKGLRMMIDGLETYCIGHTKVFPDYTPGTDYYIGPLLEEILKALHYLLSGPGNFEGGTCSSAIHEIANKYNLDIE